MAVRRSSSSVTSPCASGTRLLQAAQVEPRVALARHLVDHQGQRRADGAQQLGGLGHQRRGRRVGVGQQHDLVRRGLGGACGRLLEPGAAIQDEHADHRLQPRDHAPVGLLVELRHARRVGRRGQHHQALERAPEMPIQRGDREVGLLEDVAEVVDEHLVVGRQRAAQRPEVGVGVDGHDAVAPHARQQRAEQHGRGRLPHPALRRDDRDRRAARQARRRDRPIQPGLVVGLAPARAPALARRPVLGLGEDLALALGRRLGGLVDRRLLLVAEERLDGGGEALALRELLRQRGQGPVARRAAA